MKKLSNYITNPKQIADVNEFVGSILAFSVLAFAMKPLFDNIATVAVANAKAEKSTNIWDFLLDKKKEKKEEKEKKDSKEKSPERIFDELMSLSKKLNDDEKDKTIRVKNESLIKMATACSYDKDGKEIPLSERIKKMKDLIPPEQFEQFEKDVNEEYEKIKKDPKFQDNLKEAKNSISKEDYDKLIDDAKDQSEETLQKLTKEKEELEKYEESVKEVENKIKNAKGDDKKKLEEELERIKQSKPKSELYDSLSPKDTDEKKDLKEYNNDEIEKIQDELSNLDPEKDKDKIKEKEDLLKSIAKSKGKDENEFITKTDKDENGNPRQHKTGPRGGKYYRVKTDNQWGPWNSDTNECISLCDYLKESLR